MKLAIIDIRGIGPAAARVLAEHHIDSVDALVRSSVAKIAAMLGFSQVRAANVLAEAANLLAASGITQSADESDMQHDKKDKKKKKGKGKGKNKGKNKGKGKGKGKGKSKKKGKK